MAEAPGDTLFASIQIDAEGREAFRYNAFWGQRPCPGRELALCGLGRPGPVLRAGCHVMSEG